MTCNSRMKRRIVNNHGLGVNMAFIVTTAAAVSPTARVKSRVTGKQPMQRHNHRRDE